MEFEEVREYAVGDDVRLVDWNVTARTGHPYVKLLTEERELTVMLVVDASASGHFGSVNRFKTELAAELCAALALSAIRSNDRVGLIVFTDEVELYLPPSKGRRHVLRVIREVLYFEPKRKGTNIAEALEFLNRVAKRKAVAFLISDFLGQGYEAALRIANRRHDVVAATIDDPREYVLPSVGLMAVRDPESGVECLIDTSDAEVRREYARLGRERLRLRDNAFRRTQVDVVRVSTDRDYVDALHAFFRMRVRRARHAAARRQ
jgi:uncharacterized protein (DUF58 family)